MYWVCPSEVEHCSGLRPQFFFPFFLLPLAWTKTFQLGAVSSFDRYAFSRALLSPCASGRNEGHGKCHYKSEESKDSWPNGTSLGALVHWLPICNVCSYGQPRKDWHNNNGSWHLFEQFLCANCYVKPLNKHLIWFSQNPVGKLPLSPPFYGRGNEVRFGEVL